MRKKKRQVTLRDDFDSIEELGKLAREHRKDLDLTISEVASELGVSSTVVANLETGTNPPSLSIFDAMMEYYSFDLKQGREVLCEFKKDRLERKLLKK